MDNLVPASDSSIQNDKSKDLTPLTANQMPSGDNEPRVSIDQLLAAGSHYGHLTQKWNPKMKPYIFMARNGIYLIDLQKTQVLIEDACNAIAKIAASGEEIMFVGTKKQAREVIEDEATRAQCSYVTYRWLGGMLTNFSTIRKSVKTLEAYEKMETDGTFEKITKKEQLMIQKSREKLNHTLGGIRNMRRVPGAVFIVDTNQESIAVAEARKLGIPIFAIVDTNTNPDIIDYPIPANDDAFKSIWLITRTIADAILEGKKVKEDKEAKDRQELAPPPPPDKSKRRSRRRRKPRDRGDRQGGDRQGGDHEGKGPKPREPRESRPGDKPKPRQERKFKDKKKDFRENKSKRDTKDKEPSVKKETKDESDK